MQPRRLTENKLHENQTEHRTPCMEIRKTQRQFQIMLTVMSGSIRGETRAIFLLKQWVSIKIWGLTKSEGCQTLHSSQQIEHCCFVFILIIYYLFIHSFARFSMTNNNIPHKNASAFICVKSVIRSLPKVWNFPEESLLLKPI